MNVHYSFVQRDNKVAQLLFDVVVQAVVDNADNLMTRGDKDTWIQQLRDSVTVIISSSYMCHPDMLRAVLHLVINNDIIVSPDALAAGKNSLLDWHLTIFLFSFFSLSEKNPFSIIILF